MEGSKSRILHRNLLLHLQGKLRQDGGLGKEDTSLTDIDDDKIAEVSNVPVLPEERPMRGGTSPTPVSTQPV